MRGKQSGISGQGAAKIMFPQTMTALAERPSSVSASSPGPAPGAGAGLVAGSGCEGSSCLHSSTATGLAGLPDHTRPSEYTCQAGAHWFTK